MKQVNENKFMRFDVFMAVMMMMMMMIFWV
jgi:hypothetical protein